MRIEELDVELETLNSKLKELVSSGRDVVNDSEAEKELDYYINEINKVTAEICCLTN